MPTDSNQTTPIDPEFGQLIARYFQLVEREFKGRVTAERKAAQREVIVGLYRIAKPFNNALPDLDEVLRWWEEWGTVPECADEDC
jgi:hypothetical protein